MLKRYQVLLPDWLEEYIKIIVDKYDFSFSEIIRAMVCNTVLSLVTTLDPEYKSGISLDEILKNLKKGKNLEIGNAEMHQILSRLYFETRKAVEHRLSSEKNLIDKE